VDAGDRWGGRVTLGHWLDNDQTWAIEGNYLQLAQRNQHASYSSPGTQAVSVPFVDPTGATSAVFVSSPGTSAGGIDIEDMSRLWSGEVDLRCELCRSCTCHVDLLVGCRGLGFDEGLNVSTTSTAAGTSTATSDRFGTRNLFIGGEAGIEAEFHLGHWFADVWGKAALGDNMQTVNINGTTLVTAGGVGTATPGGIFALPSNSGHHTRDQVAAVPEVGLHLGYELTNHVRVFAGYDFLYMINVVRPADQIDRQLNLTQQAGGALAGAAVPAFAFHQTDVWLQGVSAGLEFRY
jgi:hypothetical protein